MRELWICPKLQMTEETMVFGVSACVQFCSRKWIPPPLKPERRTDMDIMGE